MKLTGSTSLVTVLITHRLCAVTWKGAYPLLQIDYSLDKLSGSVFFSTLDLVSSYWQEMLDRDAKKKSAMSLCL